MVQQRSAVLGAGALVIAGVLFMFSEQKKSSFERRSLSKRALQSAETPNIVGYDKSALTLLPGFTNVFQDVWEPVTSSDTPFYWDLPKSGTITFQNIVSECLGLSSASARGKEEGDVLIVEVHEDGGKYLNVDPSSPSGIERFRMLKNQHQGEKLMDVYFSQLLAKSAELFKTTGQARLFTMMRHPVKQAIDMFYYEQRATWAGPDDYDFEKGYMSLAKYAVSDKVVENFMVRSLAGVSDDEEVTSAHVELAKDVLRRKFLIGIIEWFDLSVVRFEKYFGWWDQKEVWADRKVNNCHFDKIENGDHSGNHIKVNNNDEAYIILSVRNWADIELYMYARYLFVDQGDLIPAHSLP